MILKKKSCIECAFCQRNQDTYRAVQFNVQFSRWDCKAGSLNVKQRESIGKGNDSFIGIEIRKRKRWEIILKEKKDSFNKERSKHEPWFSPEPYLYSLANDAEQKWADQFGMESKPDAPDYDYLSCHNEQWNERLDPSIIKNRIPFLATQKKCPFYFPFKNLGKQTLEACEKKRFAKQEASRFLATFRITLVATVAATIAAGIGIIQLINPPKPAEYFLTGVPFSVPKVIARPPGLISVLMQHNNNKKSLE